MVLGLQARTDTLGHPWLTQEALPGPIMEIRKVSLGLQCLIHLPVKIKPNMKLWSSTASGIVLISVTPTLPWLPARTDPSRRAHSPVQCGDKAKYYCTGNIEKSSLFGEVILPKHENHRPMIDGVAPLSNSQPVQTIPKASSTASTHSCPQRQGLTILSGVTRRNSK